MYIQFSEFEKFQQLNIISSELPKFKLDYYGRILFLLK